MPAAVRSEVAGSAGKLREVQRALLAVGVPAAAVQKPEERIERDLDVMRTVAQLAAKYWSLGKRLKPVCGDRVTAEPIPGESDWLKYYCIVFGILILVVGFIYEWKKGALEWE